MNYLYENFLSVYSLPTLVIATVTAIFAFAMNKLTKNRLSPSLINFLSFALAVLLQLCYEFIFVSASLKFSYSSLCAGTLSGSLSLAITSFVTKLINGKPLSASKIALATEQLIRDIVVCNKIFDTVNEIDNIFSKNADNVTVAEITKIILPNVNGGVTEEQTIAVAEQVLMVAKAIDKR